MNIFDLVTKKNIQILKLIDSEELHLRDIADRLKISSGTVHKLMALMKRNNLVLEIKQKNRIINKLNKDSPVIKELKRVINFNDAINAPAYRKLNVFGKMGFYGSFASGTNDSESDLDIWMQTDKRELELRPIIRELEKELNLKVNLLALTKERMASLRKNDPEFYIRLKLTSVGDAFD